MKARGRAAGHVPGVSNLNEVVLHLLPTPCVADADGTRATRGGARSGELLLTGIARQVAERVLLLPTPRATDWKDQVNRYGARTPPENAARRGRALGEEMLQLQLDWGKYEAAVRRWEDVFGHPAPCPVEAGPSGKNRLSPPFVEWMMGLPSGWVTEIPGLTRTRQLRLLGNGVVPQQAALALRLLLPGVSVSSPLPRTAS